MTVANATDSAVTVDVQEERAGEWSVLYELACRRRRSRPPITRFRVKVPARGEAVLTYRVRSSGEMTTTPVTIAHLSDLHFGGYADLAQIEALEEFLPTLGAAATVDIGRSDPARPAR